jgi:ATP-dependent DNA helicase RecG
MKPPGAAPGSQISATKVQAGVHVRLHALATPIKNLKGVGPKRAAQLESFGLKTIGDLLYHLPFRYDDRREIKKIAQAVAGEEASFVGCLVALQKRYVPRLRRQMILATLRDDSASIDLIWYRAPGFLADRLANGQNLLVHGKVEQGVPGRLRIAHPDFELIDASDDGQLQRILPVYVCPAGISLSLMRRWVAQALSEYGDSIANHLPAAIAARHGLLPVDTALARLHVPPADAPIGALNEFSSPAHRTIIFDELFYLQLGLARRKSIRRHERGIGFVARAAGLLPRMKKKLPFELTGAQRRVLGEIEQDMARSQPMQRLIQGDLGSGKTMVAWLASLQAIDNGYQALWMAPTEILAEQHYRNLKEFADDLRIPSALLTAATPAKEKRALLQAIERADVAFVVGTHALIQQEVHAPRMGLGVIDEQHRFGVMQRLSLRRLVNGAAREAAATREPHMLLMSATPIPRSLAMVLYGDMEVSFIDEMPP